MNSFTFDAGPSRVVFDPGALSRVCDEVDRLGFARVMLVATPGRAEHVRALSALLGSRVVSVFADAVVHVPEATAAAARTLASESGAHLLIAIGGGSAIGVAKAIAVSSSLPILVIPTTYGGSEMTPIWGMTRAGLKTTGRDPLAQPRVVIYDPELTLGLSASTTACSGLNAIAHCIEALYAADSNPLTSAVSREGTRLLARSLPRLRKSPESIDLRSAALQGAWLAGYALGTVGMGLHHKLSHVLGGSFDLPHAETHAVLLPYTAAYNRHAAPLAMRYAAESLDSDDAPMALMTLARQIGAPATLAEIGLEEGDILEAARIATEKPYPNPREVTRDRVEQLLTAAFKGDSSYVEAGL